MIIVSKVFFPIILSAALLFGCSNQQSPPLLNKPDLIGIWAMMPLNNGIANVAEYRADGMVWLHPFNCAERKDEAVEIYSYSVAADGKSIHIDSPRRTFDLNLLGIGDNVMMLGMDIAGSQLQFVYKKVDKVEPWCGLYPNATTETSRRTAYQPEDFVADPTIPEHAGMQRYIGKWESNGGGMQIQILRDSEGKTYLSSPSNENWHFLFNNVRWEGEVLKYQSFAYSDRQRLYRHPFHKSNHAMSVELTAEGKLLLTYIIKDKRYEEVLQRSAD